MPERICFVNAPAWVCSFGVFNRAGLLGRTFYGLDAIEEHTLFIFP